MLKLGIVVPDLGASELTWRLVSGANRLMDAGEADVVFFVERPGPHYLEPSGATMNAAECWGFRGPLIAASLSGAGKVLNAQAATSRWLFLWDLEWVRRESPAFRELAAVYRDPRLTLVPRTAWHKGVFEQCWNRETAEPVGLGEFLADTQRFQG